MAASTPRRIISPRLVLEPVTTEIARAVVAGDLSSLDPAVGWPHDDTVDAMLMMTEPDAGPGWLITSDGHVIGDCGTFGPPDGAGQVEIGYGLASSSRGHGYATEAVRALCSWLFADGGTAVITAVTVAHGNLPSRRVLEKVGFTVTDESDGLIRYTLLSGDLTRGT